jgi:hypothetical protein
MAGKRIDVSHISPEVDYVEVNVPDELPPPMSGDKAISTSEAADAMGVIKALRVSYKREVLFYEPPAGGPHHFGRPARLEILFHPDGNEVFIEHLLAHYEKSMRKE